MMAGKDKLRMKKVKLIRRVRAPPPSRPSSQVLEGEVPLPGMVGIVEAAKEDVEGEEGGEGGEEGGTQEHEGMGAIETQSVSEVTPSEVGGERVEDDEEEEDEEQE